MYIIFDILLIPFLNIFFVYYIVCYYLQSEAIVF